MYADVFGPEALETSRERWKWQYELNPHCSELGPEIWVARQGGKVQGQYASMPVRLWVKGKALRASWGMDVMVRPNLQRKGLGSRLFLYWDQQVEASLGLGLSPSSYALFRKLQFEDVGPVPCFSKILSAKTLVARRAPGLGFFLAPALTLLLWLFFPERSTRQKSGTEKVRVSKLEGPFTPDYDRLWERVVSAFDFIAERKASYLEWKFHQVPYVRYDVLEARRGEELSGYAVVRIAERNGVKLGLLVDWLVDPNDEETAGRLLDSVFVWARERGAARVQTFTFDERLSRRLYHKGFMKLSSPMQFCLRIHSEHIDEHFFENTSGWHVCFGDSDQDRDV